jgi:hypothetical protein
MKQPFATKNQLSVFIEPDESQESPEQDLDLFLVAGHRQFFVPLPGGDRNLDIAAVVNQYQKTHHVFKLEAYIHSGVVLALSGTGNFPDRQWDVSQLGCVFVEKAQWKTAKKALAAALAHVAYWNQYLSGDVWYFSVEDEQGNVLDSCSGCYGRKDTETEALAALEAALNERDTIPTWPALGVVTQGVPA